MSYFSYANYDHLASCFPKSYDWDAHLLRSLEWHYGPKRAAAIVDGIDPDTELDLARWNSLGAIRGGQAA